MDEVIDVSFADVPLEMGQGVIKGMITNFYRPNRGFVQVVSNIFTEVAAA
jgi:hypothetical protein